MTEDSLADLVLLCRLCAEVPGTADWWRADNEEIVSTVKIHLNIQLSQNDLICQSCLHQVNQWSQFLAKCLAANGKHVKERNPSKPSDKEMVNTNHSEKATGVSVESALDSFEAIIPLQKPSSEQSFYDGTSISLKEVLVSSAPETSKNQEIDPVALNKELVSQPSSNLTVTKSHSVTRVEGASKKKRIEPRNAEESSTGSSGKLARPILTFEQIEERMGRCLLDEEADSIRSWIQSRNNRQLFKFVFGSGDDRLWLCHVCQQTIRGKYTELRRHCYEEHHTKLMYSCELCSKKFVYIRQYKRHLEKHFNSNNSVEQDLDGKTEEVGEPVEAASGVSSSGSFVCEVCGRILKQKSCLMKHMLTHLPEDRKKVHFCDVCGKGFPALGMLTSHKNRVHIEGRPYTCKTCGKAYKTQRSWKDHCEAHLGNRIFVCTVCSMKLSSRQCLKLHMLTHTGEKPFQCDICHRHYHSKSRMLRHQRITHNPDPQFICDVCGKAFRSRTGIEGHRLEHTGEVPNVCPICGKAIRAKSNFYAHLKVHRQQASREAEAAAAASTLPVDLCDETVVSVPSSTSSAKRPRRRKRAASVGAPTEPEPPDGNVYTFAISNDACGVDAAFLVSSEPTTYQASTFDDDCVAGTVAIYATDESSPPMDRQQYAYLTPSNP